VSDPYVDFNDKGASKKRLGGQGSDQAKDGIGMVPERSFGVSSHQGYGNGSFPQPELQKLQVGPATLEDCIAEINDLNTDFSLLNDKVDKHISRHASTNVLQLFHKLLVTMIICATIIAVAWVMFQ